MSYYNQIGNKSQYCLLTSIRMRWVRALATSGEKAFEWMCMGLGDKGVTIQAFFSKRKT
jgi:hypothetical protein